MMIGAALRYWMNGTGMAMDSVRDNVRKVAWNGLKRCSNDPENP